MKVDQLLLRNAARWLMIVLPIGVWIRSAFVWIYTPKPFLWGNLLHAHSHTAYFGWGGLGVMGLILHVLPNLTGRPLVGQRQLRWLIWLAPWAVGGALVTFAWFGYKGPSIAFATLNEVLWYIFAYVFWQNVKETPIGEWPPALWLIGTAVALLMVSTLGTYLVIVAQVALKTTNAAFANAGVYLFLQAYGDGWLEVGLMGAVAALLGGLPNRQMAKNQALLLLVCMAPASLRYLAPYGLEGPLLWLGQVAGVGLAAAQVLFLANILRVGGRTPEAARPWWALAAMALGVKAVLELTPLLPGWMALAGERQLLIAFLHLKLLTVVTAGLIGAIACIYKAGPGFSAFAGGAVVMIATLAAHGFLVGILHVQSLSLLLFALAFVSAVAAATGAIVALWPMGRRRMRT